MIIRTMDKKNSLTISIIGATLILIGSLGWFLSRLGRVVVSSGIFGSGQVTIILGLVITTAILISLRYKPKIFSIISLSATGLTLLILSWDLLKKLISPRVSLIEGLAVLGWGFYIVLMAAILTLYGTILLVRDVFSN
jgi:hypothetical protein